MRLISGNSFNSTSGTPLAINEDGVMYGIDNLGFSLSKAVHRWLQTNVVYNSHSKILSLHALSSGAFLFGTSDGGVYRIENDVITKVFEYPTGYMEMWSVSSHQSKVVIGQYGAKGECFNVYISQDDGRNFDLLYTIPYHENSHVHHPMYDPYTDDIWVSNGDGPTWCLRKSSPPYDEWEVMAYDDPTAMIATKDYVLLGKDFGNPNFFGTNNGVIRWNRQTGDFDRVLDVTDWENGNELWNHATFFMYYDRAADHVYMGTQRRAGYDSNWKFGLWVSKGTPYTEWELVTSLSMSDGYRGFLQLSKYKNVLYAWVITEDLSPLCMEVRMGPVLRTKSKMRVTQ